MINSINPTGSTAQASPTFNGSQKQKITLQNAEDSFTRTTEPNKPKLEIKGQWGKVAGLVGGAVVLWIAAFHGKEVLSKIKNILPKKAG